MFRGWIDTMCPLPILPLSRLRSLANSSLPAVHRMSESCTFQMFSGQRVNLAKLYMKALKSAFAELQQLKQDGLALSPAA